MPHLICFLLTHFGNGVVLGLSLAEALLIFDFGHLGKMLAASHQGGLLTALFFGQSALVFGTLNAAVAIMTLPGKDSR